MTHFACTSRGRALVLAGTILAAGACATNPVSGRRELALVSESQEIEMGRQGSADAIAAYGLVADPALQSYVSAIGQTLAARTERPKLAWEYHVIDDAAVNAFAMPGGYIFVTRGLLTHMTNEAQLASVLGHESGHVAARHSVEQISRQQLASLGLGIGSALSSTIAKYGQVASVGLGVLFLKYSRDDETQADQLGFRYALADGYDTREMISMFTMLQRESALTGGGRLPEWQSTHPDPGNRISSTQALVSANSTKNFGALKVGGPAFLQRLDGMVYGENPRAGFFRGTLFLHPELKFQLQFPDGWKTQNTNDAVAGVSGAQDAMIELRAAKGSAAEASRAFFAQQGVTAGAISRGNIHGNASVGGEFSAQSSQGEPVRGIATFIEYGGSTWGFTAYTTADKFGTYGAAMQRTIGSFDQLTDPSALSVQPMRIRIEQASRAMTLAQFNAERSSGIPLAELALINGLAESGTVHAGQSVKRVVGTRP